MKKMMVLFIVLISFNAYCSENGKLVFGIASVISAEESVNQYSDLAKFIAKKTSLRVETVRSGNYTEMNTLINSGRVSFASICTGALLYLEDVHVLALPVVNGKSTYNSYIIVNKRSGIKDIRELEGKTFAYTDPISNSGTLYPQYLIAKLTGRNAASYFKRTFYTQSHDKSIYLVNKNVVEAAAVDSLIFDFIKDRHPSEVENIEIIDVSPAFMSPPFVSSTDMTPEETSKIREILVTMHNDPEGRSILAQIGIERFVAPDSLDIRIVTEMKKYVDTVK